MVHYGVAKAAEIAAARGLAELTAGTGVTVNSVLPGPTASSNHKDFLDDYAERTGVLRERADTHMVTSFRPTSLLRRSATEDEVANMILYVCSRESSATNGAALRVEGGILRHPA
jgi:NAD(P)-dependent dehydrogenase (short-subunit alcohol dehydrogenase family)